MSDIKLLLFWMLPPHQTASEGYWGWGGGHQQLYLAVNPVSYSNSQLVDEIVACMLWQ